MDELILAKSKAGASGSGKTTLVNILSTIDEATKGQILFNQKDLLLLSEKEKAKLRKEKRKTYTADQAFATRDLRSGKGQDDE